jgi:DNA polymerase-4
LARKVRQAVRFRTGLTDVALGLAATRLMARVMARQAHPAGLLACPPGREAETLAPLEPGVLPGLSPHCRQRIRRYALASVGQVRALGRQALLAGFGSEGEKLYALASGMDPAPAPARRPEIVAETVLEEDVNDDDVLARKVRATADLLVFRLRKEGAVAARLRVTIRYSDHRTARRTLAVEPATDGFRELSELALRAFRALHLRRVALRSISLAVARPEAETGQVDLFEGGADRKQRAIAEALTRIRARSGFEAIAAAGG